MNRKYLQVQKIRTLVTAVLPLFFVASSVSAQNGNSINQSNGQGISKARIGVNVITVGAGESFEFPDGAGKRIEITKGDEDVFFSGTYAAGTNYTVPELSGPGTSMLKSNTGKVGTKDIIVTAGCGAPPAEYKISVGYSTNIMPVNDKYILELVGSERLTLDTGHKLITFSRSFHTGDAYKIRIISSPRPAALALYGPQDSIVQGVISTFDVQASLYPTLPPLTIVKMNVTGIANGETFSFADNYGRSISIPFSTTISLGGFPAGDPLIIKQVSGPRACAITPQGTSVPSNTGGPFILQCDCRKKTSVTPPAEPAQKTDLVTRSSDNKILNTYYESGDPVIGGEGADEGRYVAFMMYGKGIDGSTGNHRQIFWRDRKLGITKLVSKTAAGEEGNGNSTAPSISADGRYIVFETAATNLTAADKNTYLRDVFLWDQQSGGLKLISKTTDGSSGNGESYEPVISGDGSTVAYTSNASDIIKLEPVFNTPNVYVYDVNSGSTRYITKDFETGKAGSGYAPSISKDGSKIAFCAYSGRLVKNDNNNLWDIFLWQKGMPTLKRISLTSAGGEREQGDESSSRVVWPSISGDGEYIAFATTSGNLVNDDHNGMQDIFLYNTSSGSIKKVSKASNGADGDGHSPVGQGERIGISYDGSWITYNTSASNFGVPKGNIVKQNTQTGEIIPVTSFTGGSAARPMISENGTYVIAGCSEPYDKRYAGSGIFVFFTAAGK